MDPEYLLELAGGDRALVREILNDFLASDAKDRQNLAAAVDARNARDIETHAHRIKGAARAIGANAYADTAAKVEHAASATTDIASLVSALEQSAANLTAWAATFE